MHETNRHSTSHIFTRPVSRRTKTSACPFLWFNRGPSCALCKRVLLARASVSSRWIVVWCVGRWTYRGIVVIVATTIIGRALLRWLLVTVACGCLQLLRSWTSLSARRLLRSWTSLSARRAEWCFSSTCEAGRVSALVMLSGVSPALAKLDVSQRSSC